MDDKNDLNLNAADPEFIWFSTYEQPPGPLPFQPGDRVKLDLALMAYHSKSFCRASGIQDPKAVYTVESCYWSAAEATPRYKVNVHENGVVIVNLEVDDLVLVKAEDEESMGISQIIDDHKTIMQKLKDTIGFTGCGALKDLRDEAWSADEQHIWWGTYSDDWEIWDNQEYHTGVRRSADDLIVYEVKPPFTLKHLIFKRENEFVRQ